MAATKLKSNRDDEDFMDSSTPAPKFTTNTIMMEEEKKITEAAPVQHTTAVIKSERNTTRNGRVIRISKVPKTTNMFRIQSVTETHDVIFKDTNLGEALEVSKRTGVVINYN